MKRIALFIKTTKTNFETRWSRYKIRFSITTQDNATGEVTPQPYNTGAIPVNGGKYKIAKAIKNNTLLIVHLLTADYNTNNFRVDN